MHYKLSKTFRTKTDARNALKAGEIVKIIRTEDDRVLEHANGNNFYFSCKLDHYKEWTGQAQVWCGKVKHIK
jgi:hypothetical protein